MQAVKFDEEMTRTRKLIHWSTLVMLVLAVIAGLMLVFGGAPFFLVVEIISGIGLVIFLLAVIFLWIAYLAKPQVREKRRLSGKVKHTTLAQESAQASLAGALQKETETREQYEAQRAQAEETFHTQKKLLEEKIERLKQAQDHELAQKLSQMQQAYIDAGLKAEKIDPDEIPGIGAVLTEKLHAAGIKSAYDITSEAVITVPGFGESKALSLLRWKEAIENDLRVKQPAQLPKDFYNALANKYVVQIQETQGEIASLSAAHLAALEALRAKGAGELSNAAAQQTDARHELERVQGKKQDFKDQLDLYQEINFFRFLLSVLAAGRNGWKVNLLSLVWMAGFFLAGAANAALLAAALIMARA